MQEIMIELYETIVGINNIHIVKAAMLRTFLYQYKTKVASENKRLYENDIILLKRIAKASEKELANLF